MRGLVDYVGRTDPQQLNTIFEQFGRGARHLSVEAMIALLAERKRPEAMAGSVNVVSALIESMSDAVGRRVRRRLGRRRARRLRAPRARVPGRSCRSSIASASCSRWRAKRSPRSDMAREQDQEEFKGLWNGVEQMLTSYTDARYVSEDYARELSHARTLPVDVERVSDDPPERIAAWLATVSDARAAQPRSGSADRSPAASRPTRRAGATSPTRSSRTPTTSCASAISTRPGSSIETRHRAGQPEPVPPAARGRGARAVRRAAR